MQTVGRGQKCGSCRRRYDDYEESRDDAGQARACHTFSQRPFERHGQATHALDGVGESAGIPPEHIEADGGQYLHFDGHRNPMRR
jgi:hypothetical protein